MGHGRVCPKKSRGWETKLTTFASSVGLFNETVSEDTRIAGHGTCSITQYIAITINQINIAGHCHLLVGVEVKHYFEANPMHSRTGSAQPLSQNADSIRRAGKDTL